MNNLLKTAKELLDWEVYTEVSQALTRIDFSNIQEELVKHPSIYSYYASLRDVAKSECDRASHSADEYAAKLRTSISSDPPKGKRLTDKYLTSLVEDDIEYNNLLKVIIEKQKFYNLLKTLTTSLEHKKDCLVQISANQRAETKISAI